MRSLLIGFSLVFLPGCLAFQPCQFEATICEGEGEGKVCYSVCNRRQYDEGFDLVVERPDGTSLRWNPKSTRESREDDRLFDLTEKLADKIPDVN